VTSAYSGIIAEIIHFRLAALSRLIVSSPNVNHTVLSVAGSKARKFPLEFAAQSLNGCIWTAP